MFKKKKKKEKKHRYDNLLNTETHPSVRELM